MQLTPARAVYWPVEGMLIVADMHLGKSDTFREAGIPVPRGTARATLDRLAETLRSSGARRLVVLGDLFHARQGRTASLDDAWRAFRDQHGGVEITLVRGNHDEHAGDPPPEWGVGCCSELEIGPFTFRHHPPPEGPPEGPLPERLVMAGHVHPCVRVRDFAAATLRLPCFVFGPRVAVLPAFGAFTGMHPIEPGERDRVYLVGPDEVLPWGQMHRT